MYPHYSYLESVNKIVDGSVIRGSVTTVEEDDPIQSVKYDDGTTESFTLNDLNERAVYHEAGDDRFLFFNNRAELCVWVQDLNQLHDDSTVVKGIGGVQQDMDMTAFFRWIDRAQAFYRLWHDSSTQPLRDLGISPNKIFNATSAAISEICNAYSA